jgi:hypothetical protein
MFTKKPISASVFTRPRFATGVPMTRSCCPDSRASSAAHAASSVMNSVARWRRLSARNAAVSSIDKATGRRAPA